MRKMIRVVAVSVVVLGLGGCGVGTGGDTAASPDAIRMEHLAFAPASRTIPAGTRLEFVNNGSRALHVLVTGRDAQPKSQAGAPSFGGASGHRSEVGERWVTPMWATPGTYSVTCTLHPSMNLTVTVL
ncbi:MAG: Copper binding protein plastocyanin/azurin family [Actinomycetota bacterium]|jgi:plastocyanin|nr:Copper binding protein plastocyanin/azurin family [Actinomycetota bacterium]